MGELSCRLEFEFYCLYQSHPQLLTRLRPFRILDISDLLRVLALDVFYECSNKFTMKNEFIGIDVSKGTLDVHLYCANRHQSFKNNGVGRQSLIDWVIEKTNLKLVELRFCLEHTGIYSQPLCELLEQMDLTQAQLRFTIFSV